MYKYTANGSFLNGKIKEGFFNENEYNPFIVTDVNEPESNEVETNTNNSENKSLFAIESIPNNTGSNFFFANENIFNIPVEEEMIKRNIPVEEEMNKRNIPVEEEMIKRNIPVEEEINKRNIPVEEEMLKGSLLNKIIQEEMLKRPVQEEILKGSLLNKIVQEEMLKRPVQEEIKEISSQVQNIDLLEDNVVTSEMDLDINNITEESRIPTNLNRLCFLNKQGNRICLDYDKIKNIYETGNNIDTLIDEKIKAINTNAVYDYEIFPNYEIMNQNTLKLHDINLDDCKSICNSYPWCNSIDHHKTRNKCFLSNSTLENNSNFRENVNFDHYQKKK